MEGRNVVILYDGRRLARYAEPGGARSGTPTLSVARADDADVTTAAAITVSAGDGSARYLLAPWIAEAGSRDLLRPDDAAHRLDVSAHGVTGSVPTPQAGSSCRRRPVLQLRSSSRIVENHSFLLADLGGLSPVHLTYTPLPGAGAPPARQPREATGSAALTAWSRLACRLGDRGDGAVRAVNLWDFAEQRLPQGGGPAVWSCSRSVTWRGGGDVSVALRTRAGDAVRVVAREGDTAACVPTGCLTSVDGTTTPFIVMAPAGRPGHRRALDRRHQLGRVAPLRPGAWWSWAIAGSARSAGPSGCLGLRSFLAVDPLG